MESLIRGWDVERGRFLNIQVNQQLELLREAGPDPVISEAIALMAAAGEKDRGAIFTRTEVVEFILDLVGYLPKERLWQKCLLEPSFGHGEFLSAAVGRLLQSWSAYADDASDPITDMRNSIRAIELQPESLDNTRLALDKQLANAGLHSVTREALLDAWLLQGDFLQKDFDNNQFDYVVGNPPYVRQESIPEILLAEYRRRYKTLYDRADLYIPFYERALSLLSEHGQLGFICSDRWTKNRYGGPLRDLVAKSFHLKVFVDMVDTAAFTSDVIAYPAITIIQRAKAAETRIAVRPPIERAALAKLGEALRKGTPKSAFAIAPKLAAGMPWVMEPSPELELVRRLEAHFPSLEESGCKVGIGVATGADKVYIAPFDALDVEPERKLPLVRTRDILSGEIVWRGDAVLNPFEEDGKLADLGRYPKFAAYLQQHRATIVGRHVAKKTPANWYRTIDRITPSLQAKPKLLIPDIKGNANIVLDEGHYYPHHNLYYVTSNNWNIRALQNVLCSGIARLFVSAYSTRMRGGYLRFQAQYLRRIRLPDWDVVSPALRDQLSGPLSHEALLDAVAALYDMSGAERTLLDKEKTAHVA